MRSFDERTHTYQGYTLAVDGTIGKDRRHFLVAIGKVAQKKHQFSAGDRVSGEGCPVADSRTEIAELYKVSKLTLLERPEFEIPAPPPWLGIPPELSVYRERGHRRLSAKTFEVKCQTCIWGCNMPVELVIDHWNPSQKKYRTETFCYGPKSCSIYKAGPTRKVPGRHGMSYEEEDWVDGEATAHRRADD